MSNTIGELRGTCAWCKHCQACRALMTRAAEEIERLQEMATRETERCMELEAIVSRLPTTADGVPIVQTSMEKVWRQTGPEGRPQRCEYFQNGLAVFRGASHQEFCLIPDCYSTHDAAERARELNP